MITQVMTLQSFLKLTRPRFWPYLIGPVAIGLLAGYIELNQPISTEQLWLVCILAIYSTLPANALIYGVNDLADWDTDQLNAKKEGYEARIKPSERSYFARLLPLINIPFIVLLLVLSPAIGPFVIFFLITGVFYSLPPIRAKAVPFLDMLFNSLYVFLGFGAYFALSNTLGSPIAWVGAITWVMAMHAFSAVPDIQADQQAGLSTTATFLGAKNTILLCALLWSVATVSATILIGPIGLLGIIYPALMIYAMNLTNEKRFALYKAFPWINVVIGGVLFWTILLSSNLL